MVDFIYYTFVVTPSTPRRLYWLCHHIRFNSRQLYAPTARWQSQFKLARNDLTNLATYNPLKDHIVVHKPPWKVEYLPPFIPIRCNIHHNSHFLLQWRETSWPHHMGKINGSFLLLRRRWIRNCNPGTTMEHCRRHRIDHFWKKWILGALDQYLHKPVRAQLAHFSGEIQPNPKVIPPRIGFISSTMWDCRSIPTKILIPV